jgi:acid phosphatase
VQSNVDRCRSHIVNATELDADIAAGTLSNYSFYAPNNLHNGHDSSAAVADQWLEMRFGLLMDDPRFMKDLIFIVTYDESTASAAGNPVSTLVIGSGVRAGTESADRYDHYNLLRTVESIFGLGTLGRNDATAVPISGIWK